MLNIAWFPYYIYYNYIFNQIAVKSSFLRNLKAILLGHQINSYAKFYVFTVQTEILAEQYVKIYW